MSVGEQNIGISDKENINQAIDESSLKIDDTKIKAVYRAFFANVGIAIIKFICFLVSKSSAMLAESIHSAVDSFNSICLMVGIKRGSKPADKMHPFRMERMHFLFGMFCQSCEQMHGIAFETVCIAETNGIDTDAFHEILQN